MQILQHCMNIITTASSSNHHHHHRRLVFLAVDTCRHVISLQNQRQFGVLSSLLQQQQPNNNDRAAMDQAVVERLLNILLQLVQGSVDDGNCDDNTDDTDDDFPLDDDDHWLGVGHAAASSSHDDYDYEQLQADADYARDLLEAWIRNAPACTVPLVLQAVEKLLLLWSSSSSFQGVSTLPPTPFTVFSLKPSPNPTTTKSSSGGALS